MRRRSFMQLAAAGLSSALVPLSGCVEKIGQVRSTGHWPTPEAPLTPREAWYFVAIQGAHEADLASYRLKVGGMVDRERSLSIAEIERRFAITTRLDTLSCVGSRPGGGLFSSGLFEGVAMADVMDFAGVSSRAGTAIITGLDGFVAVQSSDVLRAPESILALRLGASPGDMTRLSIESGFPVRLLTPGRYGYMQPKWIDSIVFSDQPYQDVLHRSIDYFDGRMMLTSAFSSPRNNGFVNAGPNQVLGYAFGDGRPIAEVAVQVDDGPWQAATIVDIELPPGSGEGAQPYLWSLWRFDWEAEPGVHTLTSRATYADGETQVQGREFPYSGGSLYTMTVTVAEAS